METVKNWPAMVAALATACVATLVVGLFSFSPLYQNMRHAAFDAALRMVTDDGMADADIVMVAIDDASIRNFSEAYNVNWPWPREFYGLVARYLAEAGARTVVFDMLFTEGEVDRLDVDAETSEQAFAQAIEETGIVVLGSVVSTNGDGRLPETEAMVFENSENLQLPAYHSITQPIASLGEHAATGVVNFLSDDDGTVRRMPLFFRVGDLLYPQLAFAAYLSVTGDEVVRYDPRKRELVTRDRTFSLDAGGNHTVFWYGKGGSGGVYRYDSFYDTLRSAVQAMGGETPVIPPDAYRGKSVVVCATAPGLTDLKTTPFTALAPYPGGEIQATLLDNYLNEHGIRGLGFGWLVLFSFAGSFLAAVAFTSRSFSVAVLTSGVLLLVPLGGSWLLFRTGAVAADFLFPMASLGLSASGAAVYRMVTEGAARRQIRTVFSRYLHEDVINQLMKDPEKVSLDGVECNGTVLFTDLQGFTTFSEDKTPKQLIKVLNDYFQVVTDIVLDQGGLLDKYTGDGIMAVFGAPVDRKDHARAACEVILAFRREKVNEMIPSDRGNILTRIGISSGPVVVGNLGSTRRMDFTAIGDTVNLSARLEGVNKAYGTTNMLSEQTWEQVKDDYCFRELDCIRVKGKNKPIRVFTLVDRLENVSAHVLAVEEAFKEALSFYRLKQWDDAIARFEAVLALAPGDNPSVAYIERCRLLKHTPELVDGDGVFTFKTK
ncbi:CHASE2 domain-containing protein [Desulfoluna spongiiphila]|uniref:Adenylate cyclase n=1 Tax=Desulfoluna spongiiphila TaxID=419481 RepID=A0A1G5CIV7_9BACT|nr:adenylate/guanylate cyclase domain-containing protein [Desulfoluna spongiiphila]SCY02276.1 adenylate cyclase [Desulfoluna spongiiphila]